MSERHKPRHIRDIAHLYLSRLDRKETIRRETLLVAAERRECMPAFHAINIAAAFARKKIAVRVHELSLLHPNAGYYLMLPPRIYLNRDPVESSVLRPGLAGIEVCFGVSKMPAVSGSGQNLLFDIIHLPPLEWLDEFSKALAAVKPVLGEEPVVLLLRNPAGEGEGYVRLLSERLDRTAVYTLGIQRRGQGPASGVAPAHDLGTVEDWETHVVDRIPILTRDPCAKLAETYESIAESLLCKVQSRRRKAGAPEAGRFSPSIPSM